MSTSVNLFSTVSGSFGSLNIFRTNNDNEYVVKIDELEEILQKYVIITEEDREEGISSAVMDSLSPISKNMMLYSKGSKNWEELEAEGYEPINAGMIYWLTQWETADELRELGKAISGSVLKNLLV